MHQGGPWARVLRARADIAATKANSELLLAELRNVRAELARSTEVPDEGNPMFPAQATISMPELALRSVVGAAAAFHEVPLTTLGRMNMAGLRPDHDVLDVGCGVGRQARYLCDYLGPGAQYEGFDIREDVIAWCQAHITPLFPNFRFQFTPLFNTAYNPDPSLPSAADFPFPYQNESFDFVLAHSVFTHLVPDAASNYLREISRVLRPGGLTYSTWFLFFDGGYSHESSNMFSRDPSGKFAVQAPSVPEAAVGFSETFVREEYASHGLNIVEPIHPGFKYLQDAIIAIK
jgi:SAM-dependent methyltransferase